MTAIWAGWALVVAAVSALTLACVGDLVSEEMRGQLDRLPFVLIRLAAGRAPAEVRATLYEEWAAELHEILRGAEAVPVTRLVCGTRYAAGLLRAARDIGRQLGQDAARNGAEPWSEPVIPVSSALPRAMPIVLRILLGAELRRLREARHITREDAGHAIQASESEISRMERGRIGFKERDIADLLSLYGVTDAQERDALTTLARQGHAPSWWHSYSDVLPKWFEVYVTLEEAASLIRAYEVQFVPGLLQTQDYARAVTELGYSHAPPDEVERRVSLRMTRQKLLIGENAPVLWAVVDEAALRRPLGGRQVMRAQLEHLIEVTAMPNISLQILPFHRGGHAAAGGPFSILRFAEHDLPDIVYLEQLTGALYLEKRVDLDRYWTVANQLCFEAEPSERTIKFLRRILADL